LTGSGQEVDAVQDAGGAELTADIDQFDRSDLG
jgi:hypothetical protein